MSALESLRTQLRALRSIARRSRVDTVLDRERSLATRLLDVFTRTWDLGFTSFGGPAVHFTILYSRFVVGGQGKGEKWLDEQTYQELFAICQALPGPASTKMLFCIALLRAGFIPAVLVFFLWSLPGAIVMYGLALGVQSMSEVLPDPVYALLSGLNASTVGIIALAAVQLAEKAIQDQWTRILVIFGACAGLCYNALWYYPTLIAIGGLCTFLWEGSLKQAVTRAFRRLRRLRREARGTSDAIGGAEESIAIETTTSNANLVQRRTGGSSDNDVIADVPPEALAQSTTAINESEGRQPYVVPVSIGVTLVIAFAASFLAVMLLRGLLKPLPRILAVFSNMYLAGTIIFGGGPVVIPLLRSYVVDPGWVIPRDFLIGLAIIQAMPGPNFNFAVYLGALAVQRTSLPTITGALLGFAGIFTPGIVLAVAVQGFWQILRTKNWIVNILRGINATAVGLVFTAVYRLWEIGYLSAGQGKSLALEPFWVVVTALSYAESAWFRVPPAVAIVFGAVLGLCWYGVVKA